MFFPNSAVCICISDYTSKPMVGEFAMGMDQKNLQMFFQILHEEKKAKILRVVCPSGFGEKAKEILLEHETNLEIQVQEHDIYNLHLVETEDKLCELYSDRKLETFTLFLLDIYDDDVVRKRRRPCSFGDIHFLSARISSGQLFQESF